MPPSHGAPPRPPRHPEPPSEAPPPWRAESPRWDPASERTPAWIVLVPALLSFVLYALTCSRFVLNDDVAEFQALAAGGGIAHAGYPLYLLLLEGFHRLPFATAPWRANLTSALAAAVTVGLASAIAFRCTLSRIASLGAACAIALSFSLWHDGTRAEIYAFTLALEAGAFYAFLLYRESRNVDPLAVCGLLLGFSITAHLSSLALVAVIGIVLLADLASGRARFHHAVVAAGSVLVGLLPLILIPLRDTPGNLMNYIAYTFDEHSGRHIPWSEAVGTRLRRAALLLSGAQYLEGGRFHPFQDALARAKLVGWNLALNDFPGIGLLLAGAGAVAAVVRRRATDLMLLGWLAGLTLLFLYAAFPMSATSFFLPGTIIMALLLAGGLSLLSGRAWPVAMVLAIAVFAAPWLRLRQAAPPAFLAGTSAAAHWESWPARWNPFAPDSSWEAFGRGALKALPARAHVLACWEEGTTLLAVQRALRVRPDVAIHFTCDSPGRMRAVFKSARRSAVFTTIPPRRLGSERDWVAVRSWERGRLWRYEKRPPPAR